MVAVENLNSSFWLAELRELEHDLSQKQLLGPRARWPVMNRLWQELLLPVAVSEAVLPRSVAAALSNVLWHLCLTPAARPETWLAHMLRLRQFCTSVEHWLGLAQAAAWLSGLPEQRARALATLQQLPTALVEALFENRAASAELLTGLQADRWWNPWISGGSAPRLQLIHHFGCFRGWGGPFLFPPQLYTCAQEILVRSGSETWWLLADAFGWQLKRCQPPDQTALFSPTTTERPVELCWRNQTCPVPAGVPESCALLESSDCLLLFSSHSFQIWLLALS